MCSYNDDLTKLFTANTDLLSEVCEKIRQLPEVDKIILFGSYAKGLADTESDVDLAVFFQTEDACLVEKFRQLCRICINQQIDIQAQPFYSSELGQPHGIIGEIVDYGIELVAS
jgi:predicted nucleotidyltransferase